MSPTVLRSGIALGALLTTMLAIPASRALAGETLDHVRAGGRLACGVIAEPNDENKDDLHGGLDGLSGEVCRAIAVAVLGSVDKADVKTYGVEREGLDALARHEADVVIGLSPSASATIRHDVRFGAVVFYDAQGFMVRASSGIKRMTDLADQEVCFIDQTDNAAMLLATIKTRGIAMRPFDFQEEGEMDSALVDGHCVAATGYLSKLAEVRAEFRHEVHDFVFLPDLLRLAPATTAYRPDDLQWATIVDYTVHALVQAEISGVTQANVAEFDQAEDPVTQRLLGSDFSSGQALGLSHDWGRRVIAAVGNYGEIYDRTLGSRTPLGLPRGLNALWTEGGLMRPMPVQ